MSFKKTALALAISAGMMTLSGCGSDTATTKTINLDAANSIAVDPHNELLAVAVTSEAYGERGAVLFYDISGATPSLVKSVEVGFWPDMVTFNNDGTKVIVANEGEKQDEYISHENNNEGSISIIEVTNGTPADHDIELTFPDFNAAYAQAPYATSNELFGGTTAQVDPRVATIAQDIEPEYVAISGDNTKAFVSLQENNGIAVVDLTTNEISNVFDLGTIDYSTVRIDASEGDGYNPSTHDNLFGLLQPDTIATYTTGGVNYVLTANEGDGHDGNKVRFKGLDNGCNDSTVIDGKTVNWNCNFDIIDSDAVDEGGKVNMFLNIAGNDDWMKDYLEDNFTLDDVGDADKLLVSAFAGTQNNNLYNLISSENLTTTPPIVYEKMYSLGGRSFSIFNEDGTRVFDSSMNAVAADINGNGTTDQSSDSYTVGSVTINEANMTFEDIVAATAFKLTGDADTQQFNLDEDNNEPEKRGSDGGPEPEALAVGQVGANTYAFIGLERQGGIMVYDITDLANVSFVKYELNRDIATTFDLGEWLEDSTHDADDISALGDLAPEGSKVVAASDSPTGKALYIVGNEVSGSVTIYELDNTSGFSMDIIARYETGQYGEGAAEIVQYDKNTETVYVINGADNVLVKLDISDIADFSELTTTTVNTGNGYSYDIKTGSNFPAAAVTTVSIPESVSVAK